MNRWNRASVQQKCDMSQISVPDQLLMHCIARLHEAASISPAWEIESDSVAEALIKLGRLVVRR